MKKIAVFASGAGSNTAKIIDKFRTHPSIHVTLIVCNKPDASVLKIAAQENIPSLVIEKDRFFRGDAYIKELKDKEVDFIVLAGFLWKIPGALIKEFRGSIINIHPALLPKYGGKGMYGQYVHQAVINNHEKETGITIHYVDEIYDHGKTIYQATCLIHNNDTAESIAQKVALLEHEHYPRVIEELISGIHPL